MKIRAYIFLGARCFCEECIQRTTQNPPFDRFNESTLRIHLIWIEVLGQIKHAYNWA